MINCIHPSHTEPVQEYCRGLCRSHYNMMTRLIKFGHTTYEELEKQGKIMPRRNNGGRSVSADAGWFLSKSEEKKRR